MNKHMILAAAVVALPVAMMARSASALVIDNFSGPVGGTTLSQTGIGANTSDVTGLNAGASVVLGGERFMQVSVTAATGSAASATMKANNLDAGALGLSSDSQTTATFFVEYGHSSDLNVDFSSQTGIIIEVIASDLAALHNTITLTTSGGGVATAPFVIPALIGYDPADGGLNSPYDIYVPFSSFTGSVDLGNVDKISFTIPAPKSADYSLSFFATQVPEPTALGLLAPVGMLAAARRRRA